MRYAAAILCVLAFACRAADVDVTFDPCSPLALVPGPDTTPSERQGIEDAVAAWARVLPVQITVGDEAEPVPALPISFEDDAWFRAIYWDQYGVIEVGRERLAEQDYAIAIAHELGHAFGLLHVSKHTRPSVMHVGNLDIAPNEQDAAAVSELWQSCRATGGAQR